MAKTTLKQGPDYRAELCALMNQLLASRGWSPARLAKESGQSKATISRMTSYASNGKPRYRPAPRTVQAVSLALNLSPAERRKLFHTVFPEWAVWEEAAERGYTVLQTDELLYDKGLPLLTSE